MDQHLNYITLGVADLGASRRFYRDIFGWQESPASNEHIAFFQIGRALLLALFDRDALARDAGHPAAESGGFPRFSLAHNLASTDEVDALFAHFTQKGVTIIKAPQRVFWGGYSGYIADPDGFLWEIAHNPFLEKLRD
ncbi:MAG: VOC family protein [Lautropia sp.]|nr:VOC family protein [Lautropia sp.]